MEWFVDDCYDEDDDGCEAPYDFHLLFTKLMTMVTIIMRTILTKQISG